MIAAHETDAEATAEHVIHGGDPLGHGKRIVDRGDEAAGDDAHALRMLAQPHRHQRRIVGDLEAFDLQVVFRVAEGEVAMLLGEGGCAAELGDHAVVERWVAPGHACFEFGTAADRAIDEQAELHWAT